MYGTIWPMEERCCPITGELCNFKCKSAKKCALARLATQAKEKMERTIDETLGEVKSVCEVAGLPPERVKAVVDSVNQHLRSGSAN